jgi:hypothetical protein
MVSLMYSVARGRLPSALRRRSGRSVSEPASAVSSALTPDAGDTCPAAENVLADLGKILSLHVTIDRHRLPAFSAEELVQGMSAIFPLMSRGPCRLRIRVVLGRSVPPVAVLVHHVPEIFNVLHRPPDQQGPEYSSTRHFTTRCR